MVNELKRFLVGYERELYREIVNGFEFGFRLLCANPPTPGVARNHLSAIQLPEQIEEFITKGLNLGRLAGPFSSPPLNNFVSSPLGVVPKAESGKFRIIQDLSYPRGASVNSGIPHDASQVSYDTIDVVINLVLKNGPGSLMAKTDIEDAFRIIPIHPCDYHLLGFSWNNKYYYDRCLPMGASRSCSIFESFSTALVWIMRTKFNIPDISHILDDFFFVGPKHSNLCQNALTNFISLCNTLGVPIKDSKTVFPTTVIVIYGIEVDSVSMECRLPMSKITKTITKINQFLARKKVTLRDMQSMVGLLNYACSVVLPGRAFLRRLINLLSLAKHPNHFIRLSREVKDDLHVARFSRILQRESPNSST
ncbi:uncharacterized protein [Antedon mediterranea]|uniref:uncharacterized protein n=1 Tax=Antedon mediterranea TaxID=105859 RepID=UPI003AF65DD4